MLWVSQVKREIAKWLYDARIFARYYGSMIYCMHSGFARTVNCVFDMFTCSGSYVTQPLVGKKRMLTDVRDVRL